ATAQCGTGQVPDQSSLAHLYSEHAGGQMESEHGWPTEDYYIAMTIPGRRFYLKGFPALARLAPDMNSLVAVGTAATFGYSLVAT
ncbi:DUF823 domain-containing adhesin, partial [Salmonella enterica subsp. enterica serovar Agona]|nr:DUF823 domain-containing adhesin [Salmonella enterica subsp. enterica serovar Agona]